MLACCSALTAQTMDGLALRLSLNQAEYEPGEEITFTLEIRNEGTQQIRVPDGIGGFLMYLDGKLCRYRLQMERPNTRFPDRTRRFQASGQLMSMWSFETLEPKQEPRTMSLVLSGKSWYVSRTRKSLIITPGDHIIQLATSPVPMWERGLKRPEHPKNNSYLPSVFSEPVYFKMGGGDPNALQTLHYGRVTFEDGSPAVVPELKLKPYVFLGAQDDGFAKYVAEIRDDGSFVAALTNDEIRKINRKQLHLIACFSEGVSRVILLPNDLKISLAKLGKSISTPGTFKMARPPIYYGRILYEDETVPRNDAKDLMRFGVSIRNQSRSPGNSGLDKDGYFSLFINDSTMEKWKARKTLFPIYNGPPDPKTRRRIPVGQFPLDFLSRDKAKAGTVKIPTLTAVD